MIQTYFSRTYFLLYSETSLTLFRVQRQKVVDRTEFVLSEFEDLSAALVRVKQHSSLKTEDILIVGLPLRFFNLISFPLPLAAAENLEEAIGYELTRHVPYELDSCLFHSNAVSQGDRLQVSAVIALKAPLQPYLAALSASGLSVSAFVPALLLAAWMTNQDGIYLHCPETSAEFLVYRDQQVVFATTTEMAGEGEKQHLAATLSLIQNHGSEINQIQLWNSNAGTEKILSAWPQPPEQVEIEIAIGTVLPPEKTLTSKIDLVSAKMRRKKQLQGWFKIAACALFVLSLGFYPAAFLAGKYSALNTLESTLAVVRQQAENLDSLRQDNQTSIDRYEKLATYVRSRPQVVDILKEVTDILATETWLTSLKVHDRSVKLRGTAVEATTVIEALASSPLFQEVYFDSPVVKKGTRETFTIVATLK